MPECGNLTIILLHIKGRDNLGNKLASQISHIRELLAQLRDSASKSKMENDWEKVLMSTLGLHTYGCSHAFVHTYTPTDVNTRKAHTHSWVTFKVLFEIIFHTFKTFLGWEDTSASQESVHVQSSRFNPEKQRNKQKLSREILLHYEASYPLIYSWLKAWDPHKFRVLFSLRQDLVFQAGL